MVSLSSCLVCLMVLSASIMMVSSLPPPPGPFPGQHASDVDVQPWTPDRSKLPFLTVKSWNGTVKSTGRPYSVFTAVVQDPSYMSIELPATGCRAPRTKTSVASVSRGCLYSTNGGFFTATGCEGNLIVNGTDIQLPGDGRTSFGLTRDGKFVVGILSLSDLKTHKYPFTSLITGAGWLVRAGVSNCAKSPDLDPTSKFYTEKAPRTTIGTLADGRGFLFQTDGIESTKEGLDLAELTEVLLEFGAYHAVNIDGGGSSVSVYRGQVIDRPTCQDTPTPLCERPVTSITCIRNK